MRLQEAVGKALAALGSAAPASFAGRVAAARRLPPASGLWVLEGLGDAAADGDEPLHRRLEREGVAIASWPPLHAGLGLALARRFLSALPPAPRDVAAAVAGFARRCRRQAAPGYAGAVFESLGFVAWNLHPRHLAALDRALAEDDPVRRRYLWHGVGRGLYFSPLCAVPGGTAVALARAALAPPFAAGRRNAVAGVAWALTLVNLPRPESFAAAAAVAAPYLDRELAAAFGDGVASALALWHRVYGEEPTAGRFLAAAAASSAGRRLACRPWERLRRRRRGREGAVEELFIHP
ncbi:MAG: hypothetical protein D6696_04380 [Acidobacteria bacterium]|nr:MAG: hypothetical protein D6696_04380 [Acidobacteriota bacterium]